MSCCRPTLEGDHIPPVEVNGGSMKDLRRLRKAFGRSTIPGFLADAIVEHHRQVPLSRDGQQLLCSRKVGADPKDLRTPGVQAGGQGSEPAALRVHDLRHTAAGLLIALGGAHPKVIQERLGHSSIKVTPDTYGHLFPDLDEALAHGLDEPRVRLPPPRRLTGEVVVSLATGQDPPTSEFTRGGEGI